ncbi:serine/threonine-protein kinase 4 [Xenopus tropicalis]|nr:serine/threonine-protein kinase 4 [Xenopus tropicalis]|eukprot:XP_017948806.1 PREDICTED: serine/threonine-protein kinase 4-like [Xenopus tropicalis]
MAEGKTPYADQKLVSDLIINNDPPRLKSRTWSQHFVSFLKSCLEKDPSQRWSAKELLQHPFIAELPPAKTIRAEIEEHLRAVQNRPAEQGLRVARWARKHLQRAREHLRGAREHIRGTMEHLWLRWAMEHLGQARKHLRGAMEHLRPRWAMEHLRPRWAMKHLRPCWAMEHLRRACDFCATETSAEQKEAQQMALEGFA